MGHPKIQTQRLCHPPILLTIPGYWPAGGRPFLAGERMIPFPVCIRGVPICFFGWPFLRGLRRDGVLVSKWMNLFRQFHCERSEPKRGKMVGASGFEPPASWSRTRRASQAALRPDDTHSGMLKKRPEWNTQNSIALRANLECGGLARISIWSPAIRIAVPKSGGLYKIRHAARGSVL